jgi:ATP-binding cassette subfamily F protein uup
MPLITLQAVDFGVGGPLLLEHVDLSIESGDRIALIGRNGAGKSTLLRLLAGDQRPDAGEIRRQSGVRVAGLAQEVPQGLRGTVFDVVSAGLGELGGWLREYHALSHAAEFDGDALARVQERIEAAGGWDADRRVESVITRMGLDGEADFDAQSGGTKRRVLLAAALAATPEVLLLDEPTNHLDLDAIEWLESMLREWRGAVVFVTHDRSFLRAVGNRIVEIDRGQLTTWPGDWDDYLRRRDERAHAEAQENARFDKLLAQEEVWIRQGIKARRVRDEGRVKRLEQMRRERAARREQAGSVRMGIATAESSGRKVVETRGLRFAWGDRVLVDALDTTIWRGDRIGLIGPNGSGKTTLIRLLLGELAPQAGEVRLGTGLQVAYFDQYRATLREDWNALDNVAEGRESIEVDGRRKHVLSWLQDFLFTPERARAPITRLSGGERNRLLLAKLFAQPANLLVMDEPTNDLDVETLELLEDLLAEWTGTLLLVSHDRAFLDRVVTSTLVMEGNGRVGEYVGGHADWLRQRRPPGEAAPAPARAEPVPAAPVAAAPVPASRRRLGYKESRELAELPARIESLEKEIAALHARAADPAFYRSPPADIAAHQARLAAATAELEVAFERWSALESQAGG